jgi:NADPH2:quinone reductase
MFRPFSLSRTTSSSLLLPRTATLLSTASVRAFANWKAKEKVEEDRWIRTQEEAQRKVLPPMMKAVVVEDHGDKLKFRADYKVPTLPEGCVLVRNTHAGVNHADLRDRSGSDSQTPPPFVTGQEGGGRICTLTATAVEQGLVPNERVAYFAESGSVAEFTVVHYNNLLPVPFNMKMDVAVASVVDGLTAHFLTSDVLAGSCKPGDWVLIQSVTGGVGQLAAQMAKIKGFKVIGVCAKSKEVVAEKMKACDELIVLDDVPGQFFEDYSGNAALNLRDVVMEITKGVGCQAVLDGVGKSSFDSSLDVLARRGILVNFGDVSGDVPAVGLDRLAAKSAFLTRPKLADYVADRAELLRRWKEVSHWVLDGELKPVIDWTFAMDDVGEAHRYMEAGRAKGKLLIGIKPEVMGWT